MAADMEASMFSMFIMFNMHVCACICACAYMCMCVCMGHLPHTHAHPHPHPPICHPTGGWTTGISKNSITLELIKIFQFRLKIWNLWRIPHPWVDGWFGWWVGEWVVWWVGSGQNTKNFKICWVNQYNSILFEDLWFVETPHHGWVGGWMGGSMGGVRSND